VETTARLADADADAMMMLMMMLMMNNLTLMLLRILCSSGFCSLAANDADGETVEREDVTHLLQMMMLGRLLNVSVSGNYCSPHRC
jgi:hypothetical protein